MEKNIFGQEVGKFGDIQLVKDIKKNNIQGVKECLSSVKEEVFKNSLKQPLQNNATILHHVFASDNKEIIDIFAKKMDEFNVSKDELKEALSQVSNARTTPIDQFVRSYKRIDKTQKLPEVFKAVSSSGNVNLLEAMLEAQDFENKKIVEAINTYVENEEVQAQLKQSIEDGLQKTYNNGWVWSWISPSQWWDWSWDKVWGSVWYYTFGNIGKPELLYTQSYLAMQALTQKYFGKGQSVTLEGVDSGDKRDGDAEQTDSTEQSETPADKDQSTPSGKGGGSEQGDGTAKGDSSDAGSDSSAKRVDSASQETLTDGSDDSETSVTTSADTQRQEDSETSSTEDDQKADDNAQESVTTGQEDGQEKDTISSTPADAEEAGEDEVEKNESETEVSGTEEVEGARNQTVESDEISANKTVSIEIQPTDEGALSMSTEGEPVVKIQLFQESQSATGASFLAHSTTEITDSFVQGIKNAQQTINNAQQTISNAQQAIDAQFVKNQVIQQNHDQNTLKDIFDCFISKRNNNEYQGNQQNLENAQQDLVNGQIGQNFNQLKDNLDQAKDQLNNKIENPGNAEQNKQNAWQKRKKEIEAMKDKIQQIENNIGIINEQNGLKGGQEETKASQETDKKVQEIRKSYTEKLYVLNKFLHNKDSLIWLASFMEKYTGTDYTSQLQNATPEWVVPVFEVGVSMGMALFSKSPVPAISGMQGVSGGVISTTLGNFLSWWNGNENHLKDWANYYAPVDFLASTGMSFATGGPLGLGIYVGSTATLQIADYLDYGRRSSDFMKISFDVVEIVADLKNPSKWVKRSALLVDGIKTAHHIFGDDDEKVRNEYNTGIDNLWKEYEEQVKQIHLEGREIGEELARKVSDKREKRKAEQQDKTSLWGWFGIKGHNFKKYAWDENRLKFWKYYSWIYSNPDYDYFKTQGKTPEEIFYSAFHTDGSDLGLQGNHIGKKVKLWKEIREETKVKEKGKPDEIIFQHFYPEDMTDEFMECMDSGMSGLTPGIKGKFQYCFDNTPDFAKNFYESKSFLAKKKVAELTANMVKDKLLLHFLKQDMSKDPDMCIAHEDVRKEAEQKCEISDEIIIESLINCSKVYQNYLYEAQKAPNAKCIKLTTTFEAYQKMEYSGAQEEGEAQSVDKAFDNEKEYNKFLNGLNLNKKHTTETKNFHKLMQLDFGNSYFFKNDEYCHVDADGQISSFYGKEYFPYCGEDNHGYGNSYQQFVKNIKGIGTDAHHVDMAAKTCSVFVGEFDKLSQDNKNNLSFETQVQYNKCQLQLEACATLGLADDKCTEENVLTEARRMICPSEQPQEEVCPLSREDNNIEGLLCAKKDDGSYILQDLDSLDVISLENFFTTFEL